jgi:hypothetical protein
MATKIYLESSGTPGSAPDYDAGWTNTTFAVRRNADYNKDKTTLTTSRVYDSDTAVQYLLIGQWITPALTTGQTVTGGQAIAIVARAFEYNASSNLFLCWSVKIVSADGSSVRKVLTAIKNDATELVSTGTLTSRTDSTSSVAGNYTTQAGDRLVIEIGVEGDPTGSYIHDGSVNFGSSSASDLAMSDGVTTANNPNLTLTDTLTFLDYRSINTTQNITITESKTAVISTAAINVHENITITESKPVLLHWLISAHENITATESKTEGITPKPSKTENITVTSLPKYYPDEVFVGETVSVVTIAGAPKVNVHDDITISEDKRVITAGLADFALYSKENIFVGTSFGISTIPLLEIICEVNKSQSITITENHLQEFNVLYINVNETVYVESSTGSPGTGLVVEISTSQINVTQNIAVAVRLGLSLSRMRLNVYEIITVNSIPTVSVQGIFGGRIVQKSETISVNESELLFEYGGITTDPCRIDIIPWEDRVDIVEEEDRVDEVDCDD